MDINILENEYWYGLSVVDGINAPFNEGFTRNLLKPVSSNPLSPILVSTKGRYIWSDTGYSVAFLKNKIELDGEDIIIKDGFVDLKGAYLAACKNHFPYSRKVVPEEFFSPQYNTWVELIYNQNQEDILNYAKNILRNRFPTGVLMIDDGWSDTYGDWKFSPHKFKNPKEMIKKLHDMGFIVMLWVCPFVTPDTLLFRKTEPLNIFVKNAVGETAIKHWWNGYSAQLDLSNPEAHKWLHDKLKYLMEEYGIDGFKFDAGDYHHYSDTDVTYAPTTPTKQCESWIDFGSHYEYNEFRACFKHGGQPLVQRLCDKPHNWSIKGLASLIPNSLMQGIMGYSYGCSDMIGGGNYIDFVDGSETLDTELIVRYAQCTALLPMMQFSVAPWRVLNNEEFQIVKSMVNLHQKYLPYIKELAQNTAASGEPIVRFLAYEFPNEGFEKTIDMFMLGSNILVAPVIIKGADSQTLRLPSGNWKYLGETKYKGGQTITVPAPIDILPYFTKA